ncbi:hypothetical protein SKAU_G00314120 [Synaphobranchus kaupii]|uniref:Uncharacterized protein n=1 Tax=Synaphobranchus kaupii TaxID=118154 RepID=A0A9Q1ILC4_SYNKA|nr:hypothetical protein SKAU_G00314120 [Synaphobranchus kaupii]
MAVAVVQWDWGGGGATSERDQLSRNQKTAAENHSRKHPQKIPLKCHQTLGRCQERVYGNFLTSLCCPARTAREGACSERRASKETPATVPRVAGRSSGASAAAGSSALIKTSPAGPPPASQLGWPQRLMNTL